MPLCFGENNEEVLKDLGYTEEEIEDFAKRGITASFDFDQTYEIYKLEELFPHLQGRIYRTLEKGGRIV